MKEINTLKYFIDFLLIKNIHVFWIHYGINKAKTMYHIFIENKYLI